MASLRFAFVLSMLCALFAVLMADPDSGDSVPLPGPGLAYGGIPYGSMSGNVADFFQHIAPPGGRSLGYDAHNNVDFAAIEQYL